MNKMLAHLAAATPLLLIPAIGGAEWQSAPKSAFVFKNDTCSFFVSPSPVSGDELYLLEGDAGKAVYTRAGEVFLTQCRGTQTDPAEIPDTLTKLEYPCQLDDTRVGTNLFVGTLSVTLHPSGEVVVKCNLNTTDTQDFEFIEAP